MGQKAVSRRTSGWQGLVLALVIACCGCSRFHYDENVYVDKEAFATTPPKTLAVLPFANSSGVANANDDARRDMYEQLSGLGYSDVELNKVDAALNQLAVNYHLEPDEIPPPLIRQAGLADAVLSGEVTLVSKRWALFYSHIRVAMLLQLNDTRTNKTIYRNTAVGTNFNLTAPTSILSILTGAWSTWGHLGTEETESTLDQFCKHVARSFPNPARVSGPGGLSLQNLNLSIPHNPMHPGDELLLEFYGTPGAQAFMDIGERIRGVRVPEIEPGHYRVSYTLAPNVPDQTVVVQVRLQNGLGKKLELALSQQAFDVRNAL